MSSSNKLSVWQPNLPAQRQVAREVDRQTRRMEIVAEVAKDALEEVSNIHAYTTFKVEMTLAACERTRQAGGDLPPHQQGIRAYLDSSYLEAMGRIAGESSGKIVCAVEQVPLQDTRTTGQKIADWFATH